MQAELLSENPQTEIRMLGINKTGYEIGNTDMCNGRDLPWMQDTAQEDVWNHWEGAHLDVMILNHDNKIVTVYNLATHDLSTTSNYNELKQLLLTHAGE